MTTRKSISASSWGDNCFHRAGWILVDPWTIIENGCVEVRNGKIHDIHLKPPAQKAIDHGSGALMSPLVNAHLHLELSAMDGLLSFDQGFDGWVKQLLEKRAQLSTRDMIRAVKDQACQLSTNGNLWVGDIASLDIVKPLSDQLSLNGIFFREYLGTHIPDQFDLQKGRLSFSVAGHAPHTTSPAVLSALKQQTVAKGLMFSIHLAESDVESRFIREQKGAWADFLNERGIDFSSWQITAETPVAHVEALNLLDEKTIAVHLLNVSNKDINRLGQSRAKIVLCPRSNKNLHNRLPDIPAMLKAGIQPALGTDSLASSSSLDIMDEMGYVCRHYPDLEPQQILAMGTINGARALEVKKFTGSLEPTKRADMLYLSCHANSKKQLVEKIISNDI